jgi:hypothetical protein
MVHDDLGASLKRLQHVVDTRIALLGREHPDTLGTMDSIAALLRSRRTMVPRGRAASRIWASF